MSEPKHLIEQLHSLALAYRLAVLLAMPDTSHADIDEFLNRVAPDWNAPYPAPRMETSDAD